jgi:hypothetical protein
LSNNLSWQTLESRSWQAPTRLQLVRDLQNLELPDFKDI